MASKYPKSITYKEIDRTNFQYLYRTEVTALICRESEEAPVIVRKKVPFTTHDTPTTFVH